MFAKTIHNFEERMFERALASESTVKKAAYGFVSGFIDGWTMYWTLLGTILSVWAIFKLMPGKKEK